MTKKISISLWEAQDRGKVIKFPVLPDTLATSMTGKAETVNIVGVGERVIFGGEKLSTFSMTSFFPAQYDPAYVSEATGTYLDPDASIRQLIEWLNAEIPLYLYSKEGPINREVVISKLNYERQRAGHIDDVWFTVDFTTYKSPTFRSVALKQTTGNGGVKVPEKKATAPNADKLPTTYTVRDGDYLQKIALIHYGKGDYQKLYAANQAAIDKLNKTKGSTGKYTIYPGQKLTIPK